MLFAGNVLNSRFKMFRIDSEGDFKDRHIFLVIESVESIPGPARPVPHSWPNIWSCGGWWSRREGHSSGEYEFPDNIIWNCFG